MNDCSTSVVDGNEPAFSALEISSTPHGGIAFSTRGCATAEEADIALEAFLMKAFGVSDEDA